MGCFWGAERRLWSQKGVFSTQVGYSGGYTPNPTYKEVCTGTCAHIRVITGTGGEKKKYSLAKKFYYKVFNLDYFFTLNLKL